MTTTVTKLSTVGTPTQLATQLKSEDYSPALKSILINITQKVRLHLPDSDSPITCWDLCMRIARKYAPICEVEFRALTNRVNGILATMHNKGQVYRTPKQTMASSDGSLGFGVAKRSSYGYAHRIGSHIRPGANLDSNPAKEARAEAERRNKAIENQQSDINELMEKIGDLILGLGYYDLKAVREAVDKAMDDAVNSLVVNNTLSKADFDQANNQRYQELKSQLDSQEKVLKELQAGTTSE